MNKIIKFDNSTNNKTDEEIISYYQGKYNALEIMVDSIKNGKHKSLIVQGDKGMGKTETVLNTLRPYENKEILSDGKFLKHFDYIKGTLSAVELYSLLYLNSDIGYLTIFDDCDSIFDTTESLNILKAVTDTSRYRKVSWLKQNKELEKSGIPTSFNFNGSVIIITNSNFNNLRGNKAIHLPAMRERSYHIDIIYKSNREKILRIGQISDKILKDYYFSDDTKNELLTWLYDNQDKFTDISIRSLVKLAELRKQHEQHWQPLAEHTLLKSDI